MRLSSEKDDPGYKPWSLIQKELRCVARLNGERIDLVFTADTDLGIIVCAEIDEDGNTFVRDGEVAKKTLTGIVTIDFEDPSKEPKP